MQVVPVVPWSIARITGRTLSPGRPRTRSGGDGLTRPASEAQPANPALVPAEMVGDLVAHGPLDLGAQQLGVVPEVALEGVLVDHDLVGVVGAGDRAAHVVAVGAVLVAVVRDHDRDVPE